MTCTVVLTLVRDRTGCCWIGLNSAYVSSSLANSNDESLRDSVSSVSLAVVKHLASSPGNSKLCRHAFEIGVSHKSMSELGGGGPRSSKVDGKSNSVVEMDLSSSYAQEEDSDVTISISLPSSAELIEPSSEELNDPRRMSGGMPNRESLESRELKVLIVDTETASWSGCKLVPVITDGSGVSRGGGSAGGRRGLRLSATVWTRRETSRRCTCRSHLAAALSLLFDCAKPLLIFNVGASDGAIEAGATVSDTVGGVGGVIDPRGVEVVERVGASHLDSFSPSDSSAPSSSSERSAPM